MDESDEISRAIAGRKTRERLSIKYGHLDRYFYQALEMGLVAADLWQVFEEKKVHIKPATFYRMWEKAVAVIEKELGKNDKI